MIDIISQPGPITFARNQSLLIVKATDEYGAPYRAKGATAVFYVANLSTVGEFKNTLVLTYNLLGVAADQEVIFTTVEGLPELLEEDKIIKGIANMPRLNAWAEKIGAHHLIAPYFLVYAKEVSGQGFLIAEARSYDAYQPVFSTPSGQVGWSFYETGFTGDNTPQNYAIRTQIFFEQTYREGDYRLAADLELHPDQDGLCWLDLQPILWAEWQNAPPKWLDVDNLRRYWIRIYEASGSPVLLSEPLDINPALVMWGGISHRMWSYGYFFDNLALESSLLHWYPSGKRVSPNQPERLYWYNYTGNISMTVSIEVVETDETGTDAAPFQKYSVQLRNRETAAFYVGPLDLDLLPTTRRYRVRVIDDGNTPLSDWRTYELDTLYHEDVRYIQYLNGFGCLETLRCTGKWGYALDIARSTSRRPRTFPGGYGNEKNQWDYEGTQVLTLRTGYLRRAELDALQELFLYNEAYEMVDDSRDGMRAILVDKKSLRIHDTGQDLYAAEFEATPRASMGNYDRSAGSYATQDFNTLPPQPVLDGISYWEINLDFIVQ
jgi:hypothetical protein